MAVHVGFLIAEDHVAASGLRLPRHDDAVPLGFHAGLGRAAREPLEVEGMLRDEAAVGCGGQGREEAVNPA